MLLSSDDVKAFTKTLLNAAEKKSQKRRWLKLPLSYSMHIPLIGKYCWVKALNRRWSVWKSSFSS